MVILRHQDSLQVALAVTLYKEDCLQLKVAEAVIPRQEDTLRAVILGQEDDRKFQVNQAIDLIDQPVIHTPFANQNFVCFVLWEDLAEHF